MSGNVVFASVAAGIFVGTAYILMYPPTYENVKIAAMLGFAVMAILFAIKLP